MGGVLIGYWYDTSTVVISDAIGPGPAASCEWRAWLLREIARSYQSSGRPETYLGGWHTRPDADSCGLSWIDRRKFRRVINTAAPWTSYPLMVVFHGKKGNRRGTAWLAAQSPASALQAELKLLVGHA